VKSNLDLRRPLPVDLGVLTLHEEFGDSNRLSLLIVGALEPALFESMTIVPGTLRDSIEGEEGKANDLDRLGEAWWLMPKDGEAG